MFCNQLDRYKNGIYGPGRTVAGPGAEASFALEMLRAPGKLKGQGCASTGKSDDRVGIIKGAVSASGMRSWSGARNMSDPQEVSIHHGGIAHQFESLIRNAMRGDGLPGGECISVLGMLWVQGEADASKDFLMTPELWLSELGRIRAKVATSTGNPQLALAVARIRNMRGEGHRRIRSAQEAVSMALPRAEMIDIDDLPWSGEHLTARGLQMLGLRAAHVMRTLLDHQ